MNKRIKIYMSIYIIILVFILLNIFSLNTLANVKVIGGLSYEHNAIIGENIKGSFALKNISDQIIKVKLYSLDFKNTVNGRKYYEPGTINRSNYNWLKLSSNRVSLSPNGETNIYYTFEIPNEEKISGTYYHMLMVEPTSQVNNDFKVDDKDNEIHIQQKVRYGIQLITHIGNKGEKKLDIVKPELIYNKKNNQYELYLEIKNTGNLSYIINSNAELYNESGELINKIEGNTSRLYPDNKTIHRIKLKNQKPGKYKALVIFKDKKEGKLWGAQYTLNLEREAGE